MNDHDTRGQDQALMEFAWKTFTAKGKNAVVDALVKENWVTNKQEAIEVIESLLDDAYSESCAI